MEPAPLLIIWSDGLYVFACARGVSNWSRHRQYRCIRFVAPVAKTSSRSRLVPGVVMRGDGMGRLQPDGLASVLADRSIDCEYTRDLHDAVGSAEIAMGGATGGN